MTTLITIDAKLKPGRLDAAVEFLRQRFPETRAYEGCQGIEAYVADDGLSLCFVETWDSQGAFDGYLAWRQETGSFATFTEMLDGELNIRSFTQLET